MRGVAYLFFLAATLCVTIGMGWGIQMSVIHDHTLSPAHAHLNLVGWVTMGLFALWYHHVPETAVTRLAQVHLVVAVAGVATMVPGIALAVTGQGETAAKIGSVLTMLSMAIFLFTVVRHGFGRRARTVQTA